MKLHRLGLGLSIFLGSGLTADIASADPFPTRAERIMSPGRSIVAEDSAEALVLNPANLANLPGGELRGTYLRCADTKRPSCGLAVDLATPLLWGLATGLRVDHVSPPAGSEGVGFPYNGTDYTWLTWGLGYRVSDAFQIGGTIQHSYSSNPYTQLTGLSFGINWRPNTHFAFSGVAHDFNGPSTQELPPNGDPVLGRLFIAGAAFRPTGKRNIEADLEVRYYDAIEQVRPRIVGAFDVPGVGRIRGDVEIAQIGNDDKRGIVATAGAEFYFSVFSAGGGAIFGNGLGSSKSVGEYVTASVSSYKQPGIPTSRKAVYIRLEATPGTRSHVRLLRNLWKIAEDKETPAVTMVIRSEPAASYAHAEELADAFRVLKAHGKKVICSFEDAGPKALYACASADRIVVNPAGGIRYSGLKTQHMYLAGLLKKIGVKAEFVRIGAHKGAPEQFTNEHASDVIKADQEDLLRQHEAVFARNMELYRHIPADQFRQISSKGPYVASEARDYKLVDGFAFDDELERVTQDVVGKKVGYEKLTGDRKVSPYFAPRPKIGLLYIDGDIIDGRSRNVPIIDSKLVGSYTIAESVKHLREDDSIKAVVLRIESPGGSSMASDVMWRELKKLGEKKPLIVSMGSIAASGGYYVAAPGKTIYALPLTITGSIGIFYGKADISELLGKIGVNIDTRKTTSRADAESMYRGFTDDERAELQHKVHQFYDVFLDRVSQGRHMTKEQVDAVGQGRVWAGQQALEKGLVDKMGGIRHALEEARELAQLPKDAPIVEYPAVEQSLLEWALSLAGFKAGASVKVDEIPMQVKEVLRGVAPLALYGDGQALARMEWVPVEDTVGTDDDAVIYGGD
jgi:protease-4